MDLPKAIVIASVVLGGSYIVANLHTAIGVSSLDNRDKQVVWILNRVTGNAIWCHGKELFDTMQVACGPAPYPEYLRLGR